MIDYKLYLFTRKKKEKSVLITHYNKFINLLMRKGLKNKQINFLFELLRNHKKRLKLICFYKFKTDSFEDIPTKVPFPTFPKLVKVVFRLITLKLELKHKKFRKKEILIPSPVSPWRGMRLGLKLLLKNSLNILSPKKMLRKNKKSYQILTEFWKTFRNKSTTCISIEEFTLKVLENSENFRLTRLFPVNNFRRCVVPELKKLENKKSRMYSRDKFLAFLSEFKLNRSNKRKKKLVLRKKTLLKKDIKNLKQKRLFLSFLKKNEKEFYNKLIKFIKLNPLKKKKKKMILFLTINPYSFYGRYRCRSNKRLARKEKYKTLNRLIRHHFSKKLVAKRGSKWGKRNRRRKKLKKLRRLNFLKILKKNIYKQPVKNRLVKKRKIFVLYKKYKTFKPSKIKLKK